MSIITGTFLSDSVYLCMFGQEIQQNINKGRKEMKWDILIMQRCIFLYNSINKLSFLIALFLQFSKKRFFFKFLIALNTSINTYWAININLTDLQNQTTD